MENAEHYGSLVYPSPAVMHVDSTGHAQNISASMQDSSWLPNHHSPQDSSSSSGQPSPMYSIVNRSTDHVDYPSPAASTSYIPQCGSYNPHQHSPITQTHTDHHMAMNLTPQVPSSIGPDRVLTRRQARALNHGIGRDGSPGQPLLQADIRSNGDRHQHSMYFTPANTMSRPGTPMADSSQYQRQPHRGLPLSMNSGAISMSLQSPRYPSTPISASPYSPFNYFHNHSRSDSASASASNPRSASPALSVASALTSVSSSNSAPNSHNFSTFPLPPTPGSMSPILPRQKQRKQRLFNVDRKAICLYHKENPNARQEDIAARYGVERSTISKILKHKQKWMNVPEGEDMRVAKHRPSKFPEIEEELVQWLVEVKQKNVLLTDTLIRSKAKETARNLQIPDERFKASSGWVENFKHRHGIRKGVWFGDGKSARGNRAMGLGTSADGVLSPLNPAFEGHSELVDDRDSVAPSDVVNGYDIDIESEDSPDGENILPNHSELQGSSLVTLQPAWPSHQEVPIIADTSLTGHGHESIPEASLIQSHHITEAHISANQDVGASNAQPVMQVSSHDDAAASYDDSLAMYQPVPPITSGSAPDISEAEDAINKVIMFVDSQPQNLLTSDERDALTQIKYALFQAASGVPFTREKR